MAKYADTYIITDPWKIIERGWSAERNMVSESLFSLGNEYMGVRGFFEEGTCASSLNGSYFNGVYEEEKTQGTSYKGIVQKTHFMVNSVNWLYTRITVDGEVLCLGPDESCSSVSEYERCLDFRTGIVTRSFIWQLKSGKRMKLVFERFLDMQEAHNAYQRISVKPENFSGTVEVELGADFSIKHAAWKKCYWKEVKSEHTDSAVAILAETLTTRQKVFSGFSWKASEACKTEKIHRSEYAGIRLILPVTEKKTEIIEKHVCNIADKKAELTVDELWNTGMQGVTVPSFDECAAKQKVYWEHVWEKGDIIIDGDDKDQQGIRFCIFQMQQTYHGLDQSDNIGAKGLTGEMYSGHAFWDTETCCLPFYLYSNLKAAKNLIEYRYETLLQAKERAKMLDCKGACYPVATLNGEEACNLWQHASLQFQPSSGVAYGIAHYVAVSGDTDLLYGHGIEMLIEISRFLVSRGAWNQDHSGFGFYGVMGPDEFHMMANNNVYTNFMAKKTFEYTLATLSDMERHVPEKYAAVINKKGFSEAEMAELRQCCEKMILLYSRHKGLYEQHEGFFTLPHIDVNAIPASEFPLYSHWSYDRIYRTDMIKQPDVLMFLYLYRSDFSKKVLKANYAYYEPRTIHESSLSPSIHSVLAADLGKAEEALKFFGFATRLDLDNYNRNTAEGLHTTSIAAAWVNIVFGFGGMKSDPDMGDTLSFEPSLPSRWNSYEFRIVYRDALLRMCVSHEGVSVWLDENSVQTALSVHIYGRLYTVTTSRLTVPLKKRSEF